MGGTLLIIAHLFAFKGAKSSLTQSLLWPLILFSTFVLLQNRGYAIRGFSLEPVGFLILLTGLGTVAIRRALATERKLTDVEQELSTARRIQFSILPASAAKIRGLQIAFRYEPMTAVAGDFYDFYTSDHLLTILIADVSGHGVPAALVACMLKVCFTAQRSNARDPAAILAGLGSMLRGSLGGQYVTAACAAIDTQMRTITYAGAGHPPSLLMRADEEMIRDLDQNGLFLGPFPHATYENMQLHYNSGDRLLLYTDGVSESQNLRGDEFGQKGLRDFLIASRNANPASALERLFNTVATKIPQDDLTAVLVHFESSRRNTGSFHF